MKIEELPPTGSPRRVITTLGRDLPLAAGARKRRDLPDQGFLTAGADFGVGSRVTFVVDVLGQYLIDSPRMRKQTFFALDGVSTYPNIAFQEDSFLVLNSAVGFKLNVLQQLLVDFNLMFNLNDNGLQDKVTPLVGIEYAF